MHERIYGVVNTDNFAGDYPDEKWIVGPVLTKGTATTIATLLNSELGGAAAPRYYKVEQRGYKLQPGFEP